MGAIIDTSTSPGGTTWLKWIEKPWATMRVLPFVSAPRIDSSNVCRCTWSGRRTMTMSAIWAASATVATRSPSFSAFGQLFEPL